MTSIEFDGLTKVYDDEQSTEIAVKEIDLEIADGEFIVFVGPSGCGKSTLLRMVAGLESITEGSLRFGGDPVGHKPPKDRDMAIVFQSYALYPHKTVRENIGYPLQLATDLSQDEIDERVDETAELMTISDILDKYPGALSGGQQQRVATARAIVQKPGVFLFDEPLSSLDAKLRKHLRTELSRLHTELEITSIYVTHDQEEAMTMADRVVVMNDGEIQQVGPPKEVYYEPEHRFVGDFIGSPGMNFLNVEYRTDGGDGKLVHDGFQYPISPGLSQRIERSTRTEFEIGIRPELAFPANDDSKQSFTATVDVIETVGSDNFLYLDIAGTEFVMRTDVEFDPSEGDTVSLSFDESDVHFFDRDTGDRVFSQPNEQMVRSLSE